MTPLLDRPRRLIPDIDDDITRREFILGGVASGLLVTAGCSDEKAGSTSSANGRTGGGWSFTDDRDIVVNLSSRPTRIAAYGSAGAALAHLGIRPVAVFDGAPLSDNPSLAGLDLTGIESVGDVYGEVNVERLAALQIDLVVTAYDPRQDGPVFGFVDGPVQGLVEAVAPIVALDGIRDPLDVIERYEELRRAPHGPPSRPARSYRSGLLSPGATRPTPATSD